MHFSVCRSRPGDPGSFASGDGSGTGGVGSGSHLSGSPSGVQTGGTNLAKQGAKASAPDSLADPAAPAKGDGIDKGRNKGTNNSNPDPINDRNHADPEAPAEGDSKNDNISDINQPDQASPIRTRRGTRRAYSEGNGEDEPGKVTTAPAGEITNPEKSSTSRVVDTDPDCCTNKPRTSRTINTGPDCCSDVPAAEQRMSQSPSHSASGRTRRLNLAMPTTDEGMSGYVCEECRRVFPSKAGKQLHRKRAHPEAYNSSLPEPSGRGRFTDEIIADIVTACLEWPGRAACGLGVGQYVSRKYPAYTADQINQLRKRPKYREAELRMRRGAEASVSNARERSSTTRLPGQAPHVAGGRGEDREDGSSPPERSNPETEEVPVRAARPGRLAAAESRAWDYYEAVCDGGDISALYGDLLEYLGTDSNRGGRGARSSRGNHRRQHPVPNPEATTAARSQKPANRQQRKRARYALHQRLYNKNPSSLMAELRQPGVPKGVDLPDTDEISRVYGERFGSESPTDDHEVQVADGNNGAVDLSPFSEDEVRVVLKCLGATSASGPDGVTVPMVISWGVNVVRPIVNSFLWRGEIPEQLRLNRTTLIPKKVKPEGISDYRPITIGQMLNRIYAKLLTKRLTASVKLSPRQKAFVPMDGCSEHVFVVDEALEQCRKQRRECNLVFLDLAKAFDTVSHNSIQRALVRFGVGPRFAGIVKDLYRDISTVIRGKQGPTDAIVMARGVKQGCPLSPILFNMVMDELMDKLGTKHELKPGEDLVGFNVLAFADDLVIASGTVHGMNWLLTRVRDFFLDRSMMVNAGKSHTIRLAQATGTRTVKVIEGTTFSYGDEPIPNRKISETVKYLGLALSPMGLTDFSVKKAVQDLKLIRRAALKPEQKLGMIRRMLLPTQMHVLRLSRRILLREVGRLDREVRKVAREILHMPPGTPTAFFYMKSSDGGLALPEVSHTIGLTRLQRLVRLKASGDSLVASYARVSANLEREMRYWKESLSIEDTSLTEIKRKKVARPGQMAKEYRATPVGRLFDSGAARTGHPWLTKPKTLRGGEFVAATKMVSENLPVRTNATRGRRDARKECRRCHGTAETQLHVLNECRTTKDAQIRRHNWVCGSIRNRMMTAPLNTPVRVLTEHRVLVNGEEFRPDLVIVHGHKATVVDVAVCYDNRADRLRGRYRDKVKKYEVLKERLREQLNERRIGVPGGQQVVTEVNVDAVVLGSRGLLLPETCGRPLTRLGIGEEWYQRRLQEGVIRGSVMVWRAFTC